MNRLRFIEGCIERYADLAWRTAYVSLRNASDADDLLQQAFLVAWRKADSAPQERAWPWLAGIIITEAQRYRRQETPTDADAIPDAATIDPSKLAQIELAALVHIALRKLSFEQRIAIVLTHLAGLSDEEAAEALGIPTYQLRARVREGLRDMLVLIGDRVADLSATLRKLPIAAPPAGMAAATSAWIGALGATVAGPAVGAVTKIALACVVGLAAATLITVIALIQQAETEDDQDPVAATDTVKVPSAERIFTKPEPSRPTTWAKQPPVLDELQIAPIETPEPSIEIVEAPPPADPPGESNPGRWSEWALRKAETAASQQIGEMLDEYLPIAGINGSIVSVGSDTLNNLITLWAEGFRKHYPNVTFVAEGKGSTTGPPALVDGTADIAPMSREMKQEEIDKFEMKYGYKPSCIIVAIDALAVYVHKDNPIESLTLPQVDAIFSSTRKGGYDEDITTWGQLGLEGDWNKAQVTPFGRNSASGTYGYFKQSALFKGDFKTLVKEQPGSAAVVQSVSVDEYAIGYSSLAHKTAGVRAVPLSKDADSAVFEATSANCYNGKYPLSRHLYFYFNKPQGGGLPPVLKEFLRYVHSKAGQDIVEKDGFIPLTRNLSQVFRDAYEEE